MAFKQLLIRKDERRFVHCVSAFIRVHLRLKNMRNDFHCQYLPAPVCGLNSSNNASQCLNSFFNVNLW